MEEEVEEGEEGGEGEEGIVGGGGGGGGGGVTYHAGRVTWVLTCRSAGSPSHCSRATAAPEGAGHQESGRGSRRQP